MYHHSSRLCNKPVNPELSVEVLEAAEDASADAGDLILEEGRLVDLNDVRGRAEAVFHHKLQSEKWALLRSHQLSLSQRLMVDSPRQSAP